jgi:uncharacterized Zn finger protein
MTMARYWDYMDYYPRPSTPRAVKGGIKAQSKRGGFGESWWAKRWIGVLEGFNIGARLSRGRSYARRGQVVSIAVDKGRVDAAVQGSQPKPYDVRITLTTLPLPDWQKLAQALSRQALFAAKLLAGEMPQDIEAEFSAAGLSLFPTRLEDLRTDCSCPDWSNPCKHIAAVYYLLGEEFDRDPFLLFTLRGLRREELGRLLEGAGAKPGAPPTTSEAPAEVALPPEPLAADHATFWGGGRSPEAVWGEVRLPPVAAALPKRLGNFPFWRGEERFLEAIEPLYVQAATRGQELFLGD